MNGIIQVTRVQMCVMRVVWPVPPSRPSGRLTVTGASTPHPGAMLPGVGGGGAIWSLATKGRRANVNKCKRSRSQQTNGCGDAEPRLASCASTRSRDIC